MRKLLVGLAAAMFFFSAPAWAVDQSKVEAQRVAAQQAASATPAPQTPAPATAAATQTPAPVATPATAATPAAPAATTTTKPAARRVEQWYLDSDGDGYCHPDVVADAAARPKGGKTWAECEGTKFDCDDTNPAVHPGASEEAGDDGIDQNCDGTTETAAVDAKAKSLAAWTMSSAPATVDTRSTAYEKFFDQVEACQAAGKTWQVRRATCGCGAGYAWRVYRDEDAHKWSGVCDPIHGGSGSGSGVSKKALDDHVAADDAAHEGLRKTDAELREGLAANTAADKEAWEAYRADKKAEKAEEAKFRSELVENEEEQDEATKEAAKAAAEAKTAAEEAAKAAAEAKTAAEEESKARKAADKAHTDEHITFFVGVNRTSGNQSIIRDQGFLVRGDEFSGFGVDFMVGGRFLGHGLAGLLLDGAKVAEEVEVSGERISASGYDLGGSFVLGGTFEIVSDVEMTVASLGGVAVSWTAASGQSQATSFGTTLGGTGWLWYKQVGLSLRVERLWEMTGHSVVFEDPEKAVQAMDLVDVTGDGTATTFALGAALRF
jgi:hypothetical protein